ncbi:MAG: hypothetical protein WAM58_19620 [Candidatus Acidiferrum sp.]
MNVPRFLTFYVRRSLIQFYHSYFPGQNFLPAELLYSPLFPNGLAAQL